MNNIRTSPEKFGLEVVATLDLGFAYSYDEHIVWRRKHDGTLWYAWEEGCSCPIPFEYKGVDDLQPVTDIHVLRGYVAGNIGDYTEVNPNSLGSFYDAVREALR